MLADRGEFGRSLDHASDCLFLIRNQVGVRRTHHGAKKKKFIVHGTITKTSVCWLIPEPSALVCMDRLVKYRLRLRTKLAIRVKESHSEFD